jgi:arylsulfatase A-like enzyme
MAFQEIALADVTKRTEKRRSVPVEISRRPFVLFLSVVALVSCSLQIELLEQIDTMLLYMTFREILWDASVGLLLLIAIALVWWFCLLLFVKIADLIHTTQQKSTVLFWQVGMAVPLAYFVVDAIKATRLRFFPQLQLGLKVWVWLGPSLLVLCVLLLRKVKFSQLRNFCQTRLAPLGWLNLVLAGIAIFGLWLRGVHRFHDFQNPVQSAAVSKHPDIYLITIDALRADEMSLYGYHRPTTPSLEAFAKQAYTFDFFFANSNYTTPTTTSIETGKLPWTHRVFQGGSFLRGAEQGQTLGRLLHREGYYTASISANSLASPVQHKTLASYDAVEYVRPAEAISFFTQDINLVGLNTLATFNSGLLPSLASLRKDLDALVLRDKLPAPAEQAFERARSLLADKNVGQPRFLWVHIYPPHDPYLPPAPYRGRFLASSKLTTGYQFLSLHNEALPPGVSVDELRSRYDENVAYVDEVVGNFLHWLDQTGRLDRSIVIVSADHGESFEHGWYMHTGPYVFNGLIRIPLLVHLPGQKQGSRVSVAAEQVDLLPTIMELIGGQIPAWNEGTSLVPALQNQPLPQRALFSMSLETNSMFRPITKGTVAVIDDNWKFIERLGTGNASLYHYRTDPFEKDDVLSSQPAIAAQMRELLASKLREVNSRTSPLR